MSREKRKKRSEIRPRHRICITPLSLVHVRELHSLLAARRASYLSGSLWQQPLSLPCALFWTRETDVFAVLQQRAVSSLRLFFCSLCNSNSSTSEEKRTEAGMEMDAGMGQGLQDKREEASD